MMAESEQFHFTKAEPEKQVVFRGDPGVLRITNTGPARIILRNSKNNLTLGVATQAEIDHDGETVVTMDLSDPNDHTSGTMGSRHH